MYCRVIAKIRFPVHRLVPMLVRHCPCTHKISGILGNVSMACGSLLNNVLNPEDGLDSDFGVLVKFGPTGAWVLWGLERQQSTFIDYFWGVSDLAHALTIYMEWVAIQPLHVVLHLTKYSILVMAWWLYNSCQVWVHSFSALRFGWRASMCIHYISALLDLTHAPKKHVECFATHPQPMVRSNKAEI